MSEIQTISADVKVRIRRREDFNVKEKKENVMPTRDNFFTSILRTQHNPIISCLHILALLKNLARKLFHLGYIFYSVLLYRTAAISLRVNNTEFACKKKKKGKREIKPPTHLFTF